MFHVNRDSNCFQPDGFVDDSLRTSGVQELLEVFIWPAAGIIIIFGVLLLNNYANLEKQKSIHKRFHTASVQPWHMHSDMKMCLDGLQKAEKFKRQEFAEACLDTGGAGMALRRMRRKKLRRLERQLEKQKLEAKLRMKIADGMRKSSKLAQKGKYKDKATGNLKEAAKVAEEINQIEMRFMPRKHKYGGVFSQQQAANIMWSPADTVVHHLVDQAIVAERKLWHEVKVASLDEIYR